MCLSAFPFIRMAALKAVFGLMHLILTSLHRCSVAHLSPLAYKKKTTSVPALF